MTGEGQAPRVFWHPGTLTEEDRVQKLGQRGCVVWLTGLSGSGKSTVARAVETALLELGKNAVVLDGDNLRFGLNLDPEGLQKRAGYSPAAARRFGLGFSPEDRTENIRRVGEVSKLFAQNNVIVLAAFVSPSRADRVAARALLPPGRFLEVFCNASLDVCQARDTKGLYAKARAGEVSDLSGVSAPYEAPESPDLVLESGKESVKESVARVLALLREKGILVPAGGGR